MSILNEICMNELINNKNLKINDLQVNICDTVSHIIKRIYSRSDLLTSDHKKKLCQFEDKINLSMDDLISQDKPFIKIDQRLKMIVDFLKINNCYSKKLLDQIWNYLIKTFTMLNSSTTDFVDMKNIICILNIFSLFDYTSSENYLKDFKLFQTLNEEVYNKKLRNTLAMMDLLSYNESLLSLGLSVTNAFSDLSNMVRNWSLNNWK